MLRTIWRVRAHEVLEPEVSEIKMSESWLQEFNLVDRSYIERRGHLSGVENVLFRIKQETLSTFKMNCTDSTESDAALTESNCEIPCNLGPQNCRG